MTAAPWRTLRQARKAARLTTRDLARLAGLSHSYIGLLERGVKTNPSRDVVLRLATALGCTPAEIPTPVDSDTDIVSRVEHLAAAHADLGARLEGLMADIAQQGAA